MDMAELLRDNVEAERRKGTGEGESSQPRRREIPDILSWVQCFAAYAAIVGTQYPGKWKELLAYQALIVSEYRRCGGRAGYSMMQPFASRSLTSRRPTSLN